MKRIVKITGMVLVAVVVVIQLVPRDHNEKETKPVNDIAQVISVPEM